MQKCVKGFYNRELVNLSMVYYIIGLYCKQNSVIIQEVS